jgi:hypothetical protein
MARAQQRRCPFLALSEQQVPARRSKRRHKAKVQNRLILSNETPDSTSRRNAQQSATNVCFSAYEPGGRRFESCRARQINNLRRRVFVPEPVVNNSFATVFRTAHRRRSHVRKSAGFRADRLAEWGERLVRKQVIANRGPTPTSNQQYNQFPLPHRFDRDQL